MNKKIALSILVLFSLISTASAVDISACTWLNATGTTYRLTSSIINSGNTVCMHIANTSITLDCQGYRLDGIETESTYGVNVTIGGLRNITIKNCVLTDWYSAINAFSQSLTENIVIQNNTINVTSDSCCGGGLSLQYVNNGTIQNNSFRKGSNHINLGSSNRTNISYNVMHTSLGYSITASAPNYDSVFSFNQINNTDGILFWGERNWIYNNTIQHQADSTGIYTSGNLPDISQNNNITNNVIANSSDAGIYLYSASDTIVAHNLITNSSIGISLLSNSRINVTNNTLITNHRGIVTTSPGNIENNTILNSTSAGISISSTSGLYTLIGNKIINITNSAGYALNVTTTTGVDVNVFFRNGTINGSQGASGRDIYYSAAGTAGNVTLQNTTYNNNSNVSIQTGTFIVEWHPLIKVIDALTLSAIQGVAINVTNSSGVIVANGTTDSNGFFIGRLVREYFNSSTLVTTQTPHNFTANGTVQGYATVNITALWIHGTNYTIMLQNTTPYSCPGNLTGDNLLYSFKILNGTNYGSNVSSTAFCGNQLVSIQNASSQILIASANTSFNSSTAPDASSLSISSFNASSGALGGAYFGSAPSTLRNNSALTIYVRSINQSGFVCANSSSGATSSTTSLQQPNCTGSNAFTTSPNQTIIGGLSYYTLYGLPNGVVVQEVYSNNSAPTLQAESIIPQNGTSTQKYTFTAVYRDNDNNALTVNLYLNPEGLPSYNNPISVPCIENCSTTANGAKYKITLSGLNFTNFTHYFTATDATTTTQTTTFTGPYINGTITESVIVVASEADVTAILTIFLLAFFIFIALMLWHAHSENKNERTRGERGLTKTPSLTKTSRAGKTGKTSKRFLG